MQGEASATESFPLQGVCSRLHLKYSKFVAIVRRAGGPDTERVKLLIYPILRVTRDYHQNLMVPPEHYGLPQSAVARSQARPFLFFLSICSTTLCTRGWAAIMFCINSFLQHTSSTIRCKQTGKALSVHEPGTGKSMLQVYVPACVQACAQACVQA